MTAEEIPHQGSLTHEIGTNVRIERYRNRSGRRIRDLLIPVVIAGHKLVVLDLDATGAPGRVFFDNSVIDHAVVAEVLGSVELRATVP